MGEFLYKAKCEVWKMIKACSPEFFVGHKYKRIFGKKLDLVKPEGFNEKSVGLHYIGKSRSLFNVLINTNSEIM